MGTTGSRLALGTDRSLYVGDLPATDWHRHGAPVLLIGLSGPIDVQVAGAPRERCRSALVGADVAHVLDARGERVAVLYVEPDAPEFRALRDGWLRGADVAWDLAVRPTDRSAFERRLDGVDLAALVGAPPGGAIDGRIASSLPTLRAGDPAARDGVAAAATLSPSRFNHLFRAETGVSFRRYRLWSRLQAALRHLGTRQTLTDAAAHGGFADAAHFSRTFRTMFGLAPSVALGDLARFELRA